LGGAAEGLVREALQHGPASVDAIELDRTALDLELRFLPQEQTQKLMAPGVRLVVTDPRRFLASPGRYDAILIGMPDPDSGQTNRFFTREFFRECAARLGDKGVLGLRLRSAENLWTPLLARRMASIQRALAAEFQDVLWLPGSVNVVVASQAALTRDPEVLARRFEERRLVCRLVSRPYLGYVMTNARAGEIAQRLADTRAPANSDARPVCYTYAAAIWLSKFFPRLGFAAMPWPDAPRRPRGFTLGALAGLALPLALLRLWPVARRAALAFVAGLSGMVAESVLVLYYQARWGALFQDIGLLLSAFMAGLALGSWLFGRWAPPGEGSSRRRVARGVSLLVLMATFNLGLTYGTRSALPGGRAGIAALLLVAGTLVGALLAHASQGEQDQGRLVSPLYAADLLGGCLGAVLGGLVAIPLLGLAETSLALTALALAALVLA
jgi:spermidine synthase